MKKKLSIFPTFINHLLGMVTELFYVLLISALAMVIIHLFRALLQ